MATPTGLLHSRHQLLLRCCFLILVLKIALKDLLHRKKRRMLQTLQIWVQPEYPKYMRPALGGLKELNLEKIHPTNNFSWLIFHLLGAAPRLETLHIEVFNHVCHPDWHKKLDIETDTVRMPPLGFRHRRLKEVSIRRAFHVFKDMPLARRILEMAVNLEKLTLGVEDLGCDGCTVTLPRWPALASSRHTFNRASKDVDVIVEKLKHGITTSARIQFL